MIDWFAQQRAHHHIRTAGLVDYCGAEIVVLLAKTLQPLGKRTSPQIGAATDDQAGGLTARVEVNDPDLAEFSSPVS